MDNLNDAYAVDKHVHFEGAVPISALAELWRKNWDSVGRLYQNREMWMPSNYLYNIAAEIFDKGINTQEDLVQFLYDKLVLQEPSSDLGEFISRLPTAFIRLLVRQREDLEFLIKAVYNQYKEHDFREVLMLFCPWSLTNDILTTVDDVVQIMRDTLLAVKQEDATMETKASISLIRGRDLSITGGDVHKRVKRAVDFVKSGSGVFWGIDICGDENGFPLTDFVSDLEYISLQEVPLSIHIGETTTRDIDRLIQIINEGKVNVHLIMHGIRFADQREWIQFLQEHGIPLAVSPTSNLYTGSVKSEDEVREKLKALHNARVQIFVGADDPTIINNNLLASHEFVVEALGTRHGGVERM